MAQKMGIGSSAWCRLIEECAAALAVQLTPDQSDCLGRYGRELLHWNRKTNLTTIRDPLEVAVKHFVDSLTAAPYIPPGAALLDMGSGGGFPGLPLKIARPGVSVTLTDSVRKKVSFLKHAIRLLNLQDVRALHVRAETLSAAPAFRGRLDVVTCRALASLEISARWGLPFLSAGGRLILFKGPGLQNELPQFYDLIERLQVPGGVCYACEIKSFRLPVLNLERKLVIVQKKW